MKKYIWGALFVLFFGLMTIGCAGLQANIDTGSKIAKSDKPILIFPFRNPYYKGQELRGVGESVASAIVSEVQAIGRNCDLVRNDEFKATDLINIDKACEYARQNNADIAIIGIVTEWIDGATNWSGKVDVAAVTVSAYDTESHKLMSSASGRQNGQWFTFVNAPVTRFLRPLSKEVVLNLFE